MANPKTITCTACGKERTIRYGGTKISPYCGSCGIRKAWQNKRMPPLTCPQCKQQFPYESGRTFCSAVCYKATLESASAARVSDKADKYSVAISHYSPAPQKVLYAHVCLDCGKVRHFNEKRITALRCTDCAKIFRAANPKRPLVSCQFCGAQFKAVWRKDKPEIFCSLVCHNNSQKAKGIERSIQIICKHCKQPFFVTPSDQRYNNFQSCSNACRIAHHKWQECPICKKSFNARHNKDRVYCSKSCYLKSGKETRIEKRVRETFEAAGFTVEREYQVKRMRPFDLFVPILNLLVEADGDYWHSLPGCKERDERKTQRALSLGFNVERITETIIMSDNWPNVFSSILNKYQPL